MYGNPTTFQHLPGAVGRPSRPRRPLQGRFPDHTAQQARSVRLVAGLRRVGPGAPGSRMHPPFGRDPPLSRKECPSLTERVKLGQRLPRRGRVRYPQAVCRELVRGLASNAGGPSGAASHAQASRTRRTGGAVRAGASKRLQCAVHEPMDNTRADGTPVQSRRAHDGATGGRAA